MFNQQNPFGSAEFARRHQLGPLIKGSGVQFATFEGLPLKDPAKQHSILLAPPGTGKSSSSGHDLAMGYGWSGDAPPTLLNDETAEHACVCLGALGIAGRPAIAINPSGRFPEVIGFSIVNEMELLHRDSPTLEADAKRFAADWILDQPEQSLLFAERARAFQAGFLVRMGQTGRPFTPVDLHNLYAQAETSEAAFNRLTQFVGEAGPKYQATARWCADTRRRAERTWIPISQLILEALGPYGESAMIKAYREAERIPIRSLADKINGRYITVFDCEPLARGIASSPSKRLRWSAITLVYEQRCGRDVAPILGLDEASSFGATPMILEWIFKKRKEYTFVGFYHSEAQQDQIFGPVGSRLLRSGVGRLQFLTGSRDLDSARFVEEAGGMTTAEVVDPERAAEHLSRATLAWRNAIANGGSLSDAKDLMRHERQQASRGRLIARPLMTAAGFMDLPPGQSVTFMPGYPPIHADNPAHWTRRDLAGRYFSNPYYEALDSVRIRRWWGYTRVPVRQGPVPAHLAGLPQYRSLPYRYVDL